MDIQNKKATRQSYGEALLELGKENEKIVVLDSDLSTATKTNLFAKEFPKRFFDMLSKFKCKNMCNTCRHNSWRRWSNTPNDRRYFINENIT